MSAVIILSCSCNLNGEPGQIHQEIYSKHLFCGYPLGIPSSNSMISRDIYALSSNDEIKTADWVVYDFDRETITGDEKEGKYGNFYRGSEDIYRGEHRDNP